ncbi:Hpt domain-containing protein [Varunaivibrio sulfuroxidans]|uniref:HPt (Histidine-containing phosphotransfer) domain-containing protein n=1 Tax=Varunaivibrio sulfuroxidans TaxID=1773489 RepID=A0A4R3J9X9_9PROT|nr:Hpt domain-containing protein [Varunaivibrio sulfuroxidans]TCS62215.1 HPt (histidine-containing phosphotransfer) domain-containing protein [Varunaivibrio sulfuroxidans]WES30640.1 Hpt domain-containing protein [Varunaivibrio sulfuroxidans]
MNTPPRLNVEVVAQLVRDVGYEAALELCRMFADDARRRVKHISAMNVSGDIGRMVEDAHSLKSLAYTYGTESLGDRSSLLESTCKSGDAPSARQHAAAIEKHISPSLQLLFDYLEGVQA